VRYDPATATTTPEAAGSYVAVNKPCDRPRRCSPHTEPDGAVAIEKPGLLRKTSVAAGSDRACLAHVELVGVGTSCLTDENVRQTYRSRARAGDRSAGRMTTPTVQVA
jgi:hypothetical protein